MENSLTQVGQCVSRHVFVCQLSIHSPFPMLQRISSFQPNLKFFRYLLLSISMCFKGCCLSPLWLQEVFPDYLHQAKTVTGTAFPGEMIELGTHPWWEMWDVWGFWELMGYEDKYSGSKMRHQRDSSFVPVDIVLSEGNACNNHSHFVLLRRAEKRGKSLDLWWHCKARYSAAPRAYFWLPLIFQLCKIINLIIV